MRALLIVLALGMATPGIAKDKAAPMLGAGDLDASLVLPPPPAPDSAQARAEFAELHAIEAVRTPAQEAAARADAEVKGASRDPVFAVERLVTVIATRAPFGA